MQACKQIIGSKFNSLKEEDVDKLCSIATYKRFSKRQLLLSGSDASPYVLYVIKGMVRGYILDEAGNERTVFLTHENLFAGDPGLLFGDRKSKYNFDAEVDTEVLLFNADQLLEMGYANPNIGRLITNSLFDIIKILISRVESMIEKLPEARYDGLIEQQPKFFQTALDKHLANYLGISPVSLSRIKRRKIYK